MWSGYVRLNSNNALVCDSIRSCEHNWNKWYTNQPVLYTNATSMSICWLLQHDQVLIPHNCQWDEHHSWQYFIECFITNDLRYMVTEQYNYS